MPGVAFIKAGTLDDTSWLDPKVHVYCDSAERWTPIPEGSQKFGFQFGALGVPGYSISQRAHKPQGIEIAREISRACMLL